MLRLGIIGCGGISSFYMKFIKLMNDVDVVAACDINLDRAVHFAEKHDIPKSYGSAYDMFDDCKLDAIYIGIPPYAHTDIEIIAAGLKIPFYIQKPVGLKLESIKKVSEAVERSGLITAVGFQDRYQDLTDGLKAFVDRHTPLFFNAVWATQGVGGPTSWVIRKSLSGGQMLDQTIHLIDMARWIFGEVVSVYSAGFKNRVVKRLPNYDTEDYSMCSVTFDSGVVGSFFTACCLKDCKLGGMEIVCDGGRAEYILRERNHYREPGSAKEQVQMRSFADARMDSDYLAIRTFIDAVRTGDGSKIRSPYHDGVKSCEVVFAADESMATGQVVRLSHSKSS